MACSETGRVNPLSILAFLGFLFLPSHYLPSLIPLLACGFWRSMPRALCLAFWLLCNVVPPRACVRACDSDSDCEKRFLRLSAEKKRTSVLSPSDQLWARRVDEQPGSTRLERSRLALPDPAVEPVARLRRFCCRRRSSSRLGTVDAPPRTDVACAPRRPVRGRGVPDLATYEYLHLWLSLSSSHEAADGETGTGDGRTQEASLARGSSATARSCREYQSMSCLGHTLQPLTPVSPPCVQPSRRVDSSGSAPVPDPPTKAALPWLHHDSPEPQPEQGSSYGTRSGRTTRSTPVRTPPHVFQVARDRLFSFDQPIKRNLRADPCITLGCTPACVHALVSSLNRPSYPPRPGPARSRSFSRRRNEPDLHP